MAFSGLDASQITAMSLVQFRLTGIKLISFSACFSSSSNLIEENPTKQNQALFVYRHYRHVNRSFSTFSYYNRQDAGPIISNTSFRRSEECSQTGTLRALDHKLLPAERKETQAETD